MNFATLQRAKSIFLLLAICVSLYPWDTICLAHPFGHDHHEHDGPSPCELREQYAGSGPVYWPPMHCENLSPQIDRFQQPEKIKVKDSFRTIVFAIFQLDTLIRESSEEHFFPQSEFLSNSDPPLNVNTSRGPPFS